MLNESAEKVTSLFRERQTFFAYISAALPRINEPAISSRQTKSTRLDKASSHSTAVLKNIIFENCEGPANEAGTVSPEDLHLVR
jgi:hypothetical protein